MNKFYKAFLTIVTCCAASTVFGQATGYNELVWSDEFEGEGLPNPTYWGYDLGTGQGGWGNNEVQSYTNETANVRRTGGKLVIEAIKQNGNWTSARIHTQGKYNFTYGRIEFRAKLPKGAGTWPALWMLGEDINTLGWPAAGEIDVMEHVGRDAGKIHATLHTPSSYGNSQNSGTILVNDYADTYHVYAAEWSADAFKFYVDDNLFYTYAPANKNSQTWPFNDPAFIIINLAMGGNFGSDPRYETGGKKNGIDPALNSVRFEVDYVRVYQQFRELELSGPTVVAPNAQNLSFKASKVSGATYTWQVPAGATITSGASTSEVKVNWGNTGGVVRVQMQLDGQQFVKEITVNTTQVPQGESFLIEDFNDLPTSQLSSSGGTFDFAQEEGALLVNYAVTNPNGLPQINYTLASPLNMTTHPVLAARIKTNNESGSVVLRIDLKDVAGNISGTSKVFTLMPLIDDGEFYTYYFDYSSIFGNGAGQINAAQVKEIRLLVDYGIYGTPGQDTFWIDNFSVLQQLPAVPNRPSHLHIAAHPNEAKISWQDNATNEAGFKIFRANSKAGAFTEIGSVAANVREFTVASAGQDEVVYKVQAFNNAGTSAYSNAASAADAPLGIRDAFDNPLVQVYPNPSSGNFTVQFPAGLLVQQVQLVDAIGRATRVQVHQGGPGELSVVPPPGMAAGLYFCRLTTRDAVIIKRILIH
ncbi:family 16 glycosylhydrolase [Pontibacter akesuensis]|nr:family 16 glycosylhydrolase [Pontibacter akesuensis]GHA55192.1 hypothetical protein GCM10007389_03260 [Pontibacter akesuensis]